MRKFAVLIMSVAMLLVPSVPAVAGDSEPFVQVADFPDFVPALPCSLLISECGDSLLDRRQADHWCATSDSIEDLTGISYPATFVCEPIVYGD
jgi:hypothetical protein